MASRNSVKLYVSNSYYHIYNRGVEKRKIFQDTQDYSVFLSYLQTYLTPKNEEELLEVVSSHQSSPNEKDKAIKLLKLKNYSAEIKLICYALLPNHFHLLIKQNRNVINSFMNSIGTRYAMYFNKKYKRKGVLFQDVYKAVLVESDEQLLHLSRYINLNPIKALNLSNNDWRDSGYPSSLPEFLNKRHTEWISPSIVLDFFSLSNPNLSYENFLFSDQESDLINNSIIEDDDEDN